MELWKASMSLAVLALVAGHSWKGSRLGQRAMGKSIWSYLFHSILSPQPVSTYGYDVVLGAFAPPVRVAFSLAALGFLISLVHSISRTLWGDVYLLQSALLVICGGLYLSTKLSPKGVSDPGGPRSHKIQRKPKWKNTTTMLDEEDSSWRCAVALDSHNVTHARFSEANSRDTVAARLTGEPLGRDVWTTATRTNAIPSTPSFNVASLLSPKKKSVKVDERLVEEMASGGRAPGFNPSQNPNSADKIFRAQQIRNYLAAGKPPPDTTCKSKTAKEAAKKAVHFYSMLQTEDGHWSGDYGGPHFLMPGLIVAWYVMGKPRQLLDTDELKLMSHYLRVHQQEDGGWGLHIESPSTMMCSVLCYVSLRLMGEPAASNLSLRAQAFILYEGGAIMTSSWAKFWLCVLGCMEWEGHNSVPPEMWLLPNWFPFHPGRLWCHCRMVYLPMGYIYGSRFIYSKAESDPLIAELRKELYCEPYETIEWGETRNMVAPMDNYSPLPSVMKCLQNVLAIYESLPIIQPLKNFVRKAGLRFCVEYMAAEDLQTNYIDIGPVNKALNMISAYHAADSNLKHPTVINHMMRVVDYLWLAEDGMKMKGYNGSQCWDTSFAIQAVSECHLMDEFPSMSTKVWSYLERTQILSTETSQATVAYEYESEAYRGKFYRHLSKGGWPFSTSAHGWPISDCTGEGLKAVLALTKCRAVTKGLKDGSLKPIDETRLHDAVNVLLKYQNEDGGWPTYENNRGFGWFEQLNPSEVFGDIMIDYSYVECSMAAMTAMADFHKMYPSHRKEEIKHSVEKGRDFLKSLQRPDGSWYGSWACCFCYACWFGVEGLIQAGEPTASPAIQKACSFLLSHQRPNGGWGEDFTSSYDKDYAENGMDAYGDEGSGVVNTGWALLALSLAKCDDVMAVRRGIQYLMKRQLPSGDWPQEGIVGVFNRSCGITYTAYRNVFPIWALGRCIDTYGDKLDSERSVTPVLNMGPWSVVH